MKTKIQKPKPNLKKKWNKKHENEMFQKTNVISSNQNEKFKTKHNKEP